MIKMKRLTALGLMGIAIGAFGIVINLLFYLLKIEPDVFSQYTGFLIGGCIVVVISYIGDFE